MRVETSGVVMKGVCTIQSDVCTAKEVNPITAVWGPPGRSQIDVCGACLEEMVASGQWEVPGARARHRA
jgi:hypothetical protein